MPFLGMLPTAKRVPIAHHRLVFCREHAALGTADRLEGVERLVAWQSRCRACTTLVYHVTDNPENDDDPEQ